MHHLAPFCAYLSCQLQMLTSAFARHETLLMQSRTFQCRCTCYIHCSLLIAQQSEHLADGTDNFAGCTACKIARAAPEPKALSVRGSVLCEIPYLPCARPEVGLHLVLQGVTWHFDEGRKHSAKGCTGYMCGCLAAVLHLHFSLAPLIGCKVDGSHWQGTQDSPADAQVQVSRPLRVPHGIRSSQELILLMIFCLTFHLTVQPSRQDKIIPLLALNF